MNEQRTLSLNRSLEDKKAFKKKNKLCPEGILQTPNTKTKNIFSYEEQKKLKIED